MRAGTPRIPQIRGGIATNTCRPHPQCIPSLPTFYANLLCKRTTYAPHTPRTPFTPCIPLSISPHTQTQPKQTMHEHSCTHWCPSTRQVGLTKENFANAVCLVVVDLSKPDEVHVLQFESMERRLHLDSS